MNRSYITWKHFPYYWPFVRLTYWVVGGFPSQMTCNTHFWLFAAGMIKKLLNKQSSCGWVETPWSLCDAIVMIECQRHGSSCALDMMTSSNRNLFRVYWPFVRGIHRSPANSPHKGQWHGALMFPLISWINGWVNNGEAGDLRRHHAHYDVTVMYSGHGAGPMGSARLCTAMFSIVTFFLFIW